MLEGFIVFLGDKDYTVPKLSLKVLRTISQRLRNLASAELLDEQIDIMSALIHEALLRNYPELPIDVVLDNLDLEELRDLFARVLEHSGLRRADAGKAMNPES